MGRRRETQVWVESPPDPERTSRASMVHVPIGVCRNHSRLASRPGSVIRVQRPLPLTTYTSCQMLYTSCISWKLRLPTEG